HAEIKPVYGVHGKPLHRSDRRTARLVVLGFYGFLCHDGSPYHELSVTGTVLERVLAHYRGLLFGFLVLFTGDFRRRAAWDDLEASSRRSRSRMRRSSRAISAHAGRSAWARVVLTRPSIIAASVLT